MYNCKCTLHNHKPKFVVLTGGPSAGKTAVLEMVLKSFCQHVTVIPESASIVFGGGFFRRKTLPARKGAQRAIFRVQRELEQIVIEEQQSALAICDRGTVDGLAYWPTNEDDFWRELQSSKSAEFARYAAVIHLRTPTLEQGYNLDNPVRIESAQEALKIDKKLVDAWSGHPNVIYIDSEDDFFSKAQKALSTIQSLVPPCCQKKC